jgi:trehalose/maltose transport system substrate-binding protein
MKGLRLCGATALFVLSAVSARAETVAIACGAVGKELEICRTLSEAWAKKTGNTVKIVSTPNSATERLALYQQLLAAGSPDVDVFEIDTIWPGILGTHFSDLGGRIKDTGAYFPPIIENDTRDGKLIAMPIYTDAGLMYYRKDLLDKYSLKPPATWDELTAAAKTITEAEHAAGNGGLQGIVFQGKAYEGLTCNALEWIASYGGGTIVAPDGKVTINNPDAVKALDMAAGWLKSGLAPQGVLNYTEEEARGVFQSGNAVFMRNWPYAWTLAQSADSPVKNKIGVMPIPKGGPDGKRPSALGGWQMAVSKYSKHQDLAADLAATLTSPEAAKQWALMGGYAPAVPALYKDSEVVQANPLLSDLYESFTGAVPRPATVTGSKYNQVSAEFFNAVTDVLTGKSDGKTAVAALDAKLNRMSRGGKW